MKPSRDVDQRLVDAILLGRFEHAHDLAPLEADRSLLLWLQKTELPRDRVIAWRTSFSESASRIGAASPHVALAVRRFLARGLSHSVETLEGRGAIYEGEPLGRFLLEVDLPEEAAASLYASVAREPSSGRAALLLANALVRLGQLEEARDHYRRALRVAPFDLHLEEIEDLELRELASFAGELGIEGDVRPWLPVIGFLEDVLPLSALDPVPGEGFGEATRAYDLIIAHKGARSHGERLAVRRDLAGLAPLLLESLVRARKLDAVPILAGTS